MQPAGGVRYFVVQTQPGRQDVAEENLTNQGYRVFNPTVKVLVKNPRYQGVSHQRVEPAFRGYLFVALDLSCDPWRSINGTRGVMNILGEPERPVPLPIGEIEKLVAQFSTGEFDEKPQPPLLKGQLGQVTAGPFSGFLGVCRVAAADRVQLLLNIFGRKTETWLPRDVVQAA